MCFKKTISMTSCFEFVRCLPHLKNINIKPPCRPSPVRRPSRSHSPPPSLLRPSSPLLHPAHIYPICPTPQVGIIWVGSLREWIRAVSNSIMSNLIDGALPGQFARNEMMMIVFIFSGPFLNQNAFFANTDHFGQQQWTRMNDLQFSFRSTLPISPALSPFLWPARDPISSVVFFYAGISSEANGRRDCFPVFL